MRDGSRTVSALEPIVLPRRAGRKLRAQKLHGQILFGTCQVTLRFIWWVCVRKRWRGEEVLPTQVSQKKEKYQYNIHVQRKSEKVFDRSRLPICDSPHLSRLKFDDFTCIFSSSVMRMD